MSDKGLSHPRADAGGLPYAGGTGHVNAADYGKRYRRFACCREMDVPFIEACLSLTLLYPIARWAAFRLEHRLMARLLVMSLGMLPTSGWCGQFTAAFTLICAFYIGSVIAEPARETLSASLADARAREAIYEL